MSPLGGRLRLIALIEEAAVIGRVLRHLGVPAVLPVVRPTVRRRCSPWRATYSSRTIPSG